jgi:hypothetical protein
LGIKTDNFGLVIWDSKSPRQFLGLSLKTKWVSVYRLYHKTNGGRSSRDTCQDLAALMTAGGACGTIAEVASEAS